MPVNRGLSDLGNMEDRYSQVKLTAYIYWQTNKQYVESSQAEFETAVVNQCHSD